MLNPFLFFVESVVSVVGSVTAENEFRLGGLLRTQKCAKRMFEAFGSGGPNHTHHRAHKKIGAGLTPPRKLSNGSAISRILSSETIDAVSGGDYSSGNQVTLALKQSYPGALCWSHRSSLARKLGTNAPLFDLAPRRVWLFSLQRLPFGFPFPAEGSMPWTFSLFHCSSSYDGGSLTPALPYGVRTFLNISHPNGVTFALAQNIAIACRSWNRTIAGAVRHV